MKKVQDSYRTLYKRATNSSKMWQLQIRGEALDLIVANNPATYAACKTLLVNRFSDPSSEVLLFNRLSVCYQLSTQSYEKYADEITAG